MRLFKWFAIAASLGTAFAANALGQRQMEKLDRGLVAINQGKDIGVFLSWRLLGTESQELGFNVYRQRGSANPKKLNDQPLKAGTNFIDRNAKLDEALSPYFLFRPELDPLDFEPGVMYAVNEYDLASRLSYFLWNSMPDDDLITLEENGKLRTELEDQVKRMVKDPKSNSFFENFAEQWLALRKLDISSPDYPEETPLNNLWLAMLERFGAPSQKLVDSTGVLGGLS